MITGSGKSRLPHIFETYSRYILLTCSFCRRKFRPRLRLCLPPRSFGTALKDNSLPIYLLRLNPSSLFLSSVFSAQYQLLLHRVCRQAHPLFQPGLHQVTIRLHQMTIHFIRSLPPGTFFHHRKQQNRHRIYLPLPLHS